MQVQSACPARSLGLRHMPKSICAPRRATGKALVSRVAAAADAKFIPPWRDCFSELQAKGLRTISPEDAAGMIASGEWVLLDVRRPDQHEEAHPQGAVSVPMYRLIDTSSLDVARVLKLVAFSFNGVSPIESNSDFVAEALAATGGKRIITVCEAGGTMRQTVNFPQGKPSRSLQAAFKLIKEGGLSGDSVAHLERGVYGWYQAELPMTGQYSPDLGRTPMAAKDPTLANVAQGAGYEMKDSDKPLQPQKKNWFGF